MLGQARQGPEICSGMGPGKAGVGRGHTWQGRDLGFRQRGEATCAPLSPSGEKGSRPRLCLHPRLVSGPGFPPHQVGKPAVSASQGPGVAQGRKGWDNNVFLKTLERRVVVGIGVGPLAPFPPGEDRASRLGPETTPYQPREPLDAPPVKMPCTEQCPQNRGKIRAG